MTREEFAATVKTYRRERNLTQEAAAACLGISVRTLQNWEIARNMPSGFGLRALLAAFVVPLPQEARIEKVPPEPEPESAGDTLETHLL